MSECVVRMNMPRSCDVCPCLDDYGDYPRCRISGEQRGYNFPTREKRMPNCPIICQLPEGHGRLVDADKEIDFHVNDFERIKTEGIDVYSKAYSLSDLCDGITYAYDHANIIIPAERRRKYEKRGSY